MNRRRFIKTLGVGAAGAVAATAAGCLTYEPDGWERREWAKDFPHFDPSEQYGGCLTIKPSEHGSCTVLSCGEQARLEPKMWEEIRMVIPPAFRDEKYLTFDWVNPACEISDGTHLVCFWKWSKA